MNGCTLRSGPWKRVWGPVVALAMVSSMARADVHYWINTNGGTFATPGNWNPAATPVENDDVFFMSNAAYTVTFDADTAYLARSIADAVNAAVTFDLAGFTWSSSNQVQVTSQNNRTNHVLIANGTFLATNAARNNATILSSGGAGSYGNLTFSNVQWRMDRLLVANSASTVADLTLHNSTGLVFNSIELARNSGTRGTINLHGSQLDTRNATFVYAGQSGYGDLILRDNSSWLSSNTVYVGFTATGTVQLANSLWSHQSGSDIVVGQNNGSDGTILLSDNSVLTTTNVPGTGVTLGGSGTGRMILSNSTFLGKLLVGNSRSGALTLVGGHYTYVGPGNVTTPFGMGAGVTGTVTLVNGASFVATNNLLTVVGQSGVGIVSITNSMFRTGDLTLGNASGSKGTVSMSGGETIVRGTLRVGNSGQGAMTLRDGALLEATNILVAAAAGNVLSNLGGVYQFTTATPGLTPNGTGKIAVQDSTISFRNVANADVLSNVSGPLTNIAFAGNNTFRLNHATNAVVASYAFESVAHTADPTQYRALSLTNHARWQSGSLTIGTNGAVSADATSTLALTGDFNIRNNNALDFDLSTATVSFTGGGDHTNLVTGLDLGHDGAMGYADGFTRNFSYGTLALGATDHLYVGSGSGATSNALYFSSLVLPGNDTNYIANLHTLGSGITLYYAAAALSPDNAYLGDQTYALDGGGWLMPAIPEPSVAAFLTLAAALLRRRRSR